MGNYNPNYFEKKAGSLEEAILNAVNGVKTQINEDSMNVELANDKMLMRNIEKMGVKIKVLNRFDPKNPTVQLIGKKDKINKVVDKYQTNMSSDNNFAFNEKMDAVGQEDGDIDNDGDKDSSDKYLAKRRKAIGKAMKKEETIFEATGKDIAKKMMGSKTMKSFASKVAKMKSVTKGDLEKMLPDYVAGADISKLFEAQDGGDFKTHMMYDPKTGKGYEAKTMDDHLRMKKMGYSHEKPKMDEAMKGFKVEFGKGNDAGMAVYKDKKDAEAFAKRQPKPIKITQIDVKNANMFDDPNPTRKEAYELGTDEYTNHTKKMTPGQFESQGKEDWNEVVTNIQKKQTSMREALAKVWGIDEGKSPFESFATGDQKMKEKKQKNGKTMTGKPMTKVDVEPSMKEKQY